MKRHNSLIVACSGVQWWYDQLFSECIAAACKALTIEAMQREIAMQTDFLK